MKILASVIVTGVLVSIGASAVGLTPAPAVAQEEGGVYRVAPNVYSLPPGRYQVDYPETTGVRKFEITETQGRQEVRIDTPAHVSREAPDGSVEFYDLPKDG